MHPILLNSLTSTPISVISGFPGIGKSTLVREFPGEVADSDSSKFSKENFPQNYIAHIKEAIHEYAYVLVSSHKDVREALVANRIPFLLVYPVEECKEEYLQRYRDRGSPQSFIDLLDKNWSIWLEECRNQTGCQHIELEPGEYLADVFFFRQTRSSPKKGSRTI